MQYTVIKSEGKWFLLEKGWLENKLPTLHEHSDYWAKLEGKVIEDGELELSTKLIDKRWRLTAFPKQESQEDLWREVIVYSAPTNSLLGSEINEAIDYLKQHFTITRK
jgi:hypothetical protein